MASSAAAIADEVSSPFQAVGCCNAPGEPPPRQSSIVACVLFAIGAGVLHAGGWLFPGAWYTVWLGQAALVGLGLVCRPARALVLGCLAGAIGTGCSFYWGVECLRATVDASPAVAVVVYLALISVESLAFGIFCWFVARMSQAGARFFWLVPCAWAAIEHWYPHLFPWKIGYSQLELLPLLQIADLVGSTGIGFVLTMVAAAAALLGRSRWRASTAERWFARRYAIVAALLLACTLGYGVASVRRWDAWTATQPKLKVALVQVDPVYVGSEEKLRSRSLAVAGQVDLICWPETALGVYCDDLKHFRDAENTQRLSRDSQLSLEPANDLGCHLLAGGKLYAADATDEGPYSMAALLISPEREILGKYRKRTLMPLGEYVPGQSHFPSIRHWMTIKDIIVAGADAQPLTTTTGQRLGVLMCYEDTIISNARKTVACGAEALFSLIQGTAFENRLTLIQHQRLAAMRAVENRRYFVRCASTGFTCVVAPTGRIIASLPLQGEGTLLSEVSFVQTRTLYTHAGDWFPNLCTALAFIGVLFAWCRHRP